MSKQTDLELIIDNCCKVKISSFNVLREKIITNFTNCNFYQCSITKLDLSNLKESRGKKLIMTRPKFREYFRKRLYITLFKNKMVRENGHHIEDVIFNDGLNRDLIEELIETCLRIFVEKQKGLIWDLKGLKGNCTLCIDTEKMDQNKDTCYNIYLFNVDYKKIFSWIFDNFQKIKTWNKENIKEEIKKENIIRINNDNFEKYMNFDNLKTYSILNPILGCHWKLDITININENKMYLGGLDIDNFDGALYHIFKAACHLQLNNLDFEYLEANGDAHSYDEYVMDFNLEEISKLMQ